MEIIYSDKTEFGKERKISKFYRALATGIIDNDEVLPLSFPSTHLSSYSYLFDSELLIMTPCCSSNLFRHIYRLWLPNP